MITYNIDGAELVLSYEETEEYNDEWAGPMRRNVKRECRIPLAGALGLASFIDKHVPPALEKNKTAHIQQMEETEKRLEEELARVRNSLAFTRGRKT